MQTSLESYYFHALSFCEKTFLPDLSEAYEYFFQNLPEKAHILDAGCGGGRDAQNFESLGHEVTAFDASSEMIQVASNILQKPPLLLRFDQIEWELCFDGIWACRSLHHLCGPELLEALAKLAKSLKEGGVLY